MDERSWQERWGLNGAEFHHIVFLVGVAFLFASPFFALVNGEAGVLAFVVGLLAVFGAAHAAPDSDDKPEP